MKRINVVFTASGLKQAMNDVMDYAQWVENKQNELSKRLADIGASIAWVRFDRVRGVDDEITVTVSDDGKTATIYAEGKDVAFLEFGSGILEGYGHPDAELDGKPMGPGTYPGKGHWNSPNGWWYAHGKHSYGNAPAMAMYDAKRIITEQVTDIAREVFKND